MAKKLLVKDGKLVVRGGKLVVASDPANCDCCGSSCVGASFAEAFDGAIPGEWFTNVTSGATLSVVGGRARLYRVAGASGVALGPCVRKSVFNVPRTITLETQIAADILTGSVGDFQQGMRCDLGELRYDWRWYEVGFARPGTSQNLRFTHQEGSTVTTVDYPHAITDGDVLKLVITGANAGEVDSVEAYVNGGLIHSTVYGVPESMSITPPPNPLVSIYAQGNTGGQIYHWFEYFDLTIA